MLSELSNDLLIIILSFLPIKEAIRTSTLSLRWRNLWKFPYSLDIEIPDLLNDQATNFSKFDKILSSIQSSNVPKLQVRKIPYCRNNKIVDSTAQFCIKHHVPELALCFQIPYGHRFDTIFGIQSLVRLQLENCLIYDTHPNFATGLPKLRSLVLKKTRFQNDGIEKLFCMCPSLEFLSVDDANQWDCRIRHANLRSLYIGTARTVIILNTPALQLLRLNHWPATGLQHIIFREITSLVRCEFHGSCRMVSDSDVEALMECISSNFRYVETICLSAKHCVQDRFVSATEYSKQGLDSTKLVWETLLTKNDDIKAIAKMLSSFHRLEKLQLIMEEYVESCKVDVGSKLWKSLEQTLTKMQRLKEVDIHGFATYESLCLGPVQASATNIKLVEALLKNLPALEIVRVYVNRKIMFFDDDSKHQFLKVFDMIQCLPRLSPNATVEFFYS